MQPWRLARRRDIMLWNSRGAIAPTGSAALRCGPFADGRGGEALLIADAEAAGNSAPRVCDVTGPAACMSVVDVIVFRLLYHLYQLHHSPVFMRQDVTMIYKLAGEVREEAAHFEVAGNLDSTRAA